MSEKSASKSGYFAVWLALMVLLALTWGVAQLSLGVANTVAALVIATVKLLLVILFFMHVRYQGRSIWLFAGAGFVWLLIMVTLTLTDYLSRGVVKPYNGPAPLSAANAPGSTQPPASAVR